MDCFEEVLRRGVKIDYMFAIHVVSYIPPRMTPAVVARLKAAGMDLAERDAIGLASALITSCSLVNNDVLAEKLFFSCTHNLRTNMLCRRMLHCYCSTLNYSAAFTLISDHPKIIKAKEIGICMGLFVQAAQKHCEDETKLNDIIRMAGDCIGCVQNGYCSEVAFWCQQRINSNSSYREKNGACREVCWYSPSL